MGHSYRVRIGLREIQAMQPNTILWDQEVKGFVARRQHSDVVTFSVVYRTLQGTQRWQKLERFPILTPHLARQEAIKILRAKALGEDPAGAKMALRNGMTVNELCDLYIVDMDAGRVNGKKSSTIISDKSRIKWHIRPKLGKLKIASVTNEVVEDFMHSLSAGSANRITSLLSAIFNFGIKKKLCATNPCTGVDKPSDVKRTRRLSDVEYVQFGQSLRSAPNHTIADIFLMLAITGFRSGEIKNLRWDELDLPRQLANLADTKSGPSTRPLSIEAIKIIEAQPKNGPYVFHHNGEPFGYINKHWLKLELDRTITQHTLRHSFASLAGDMGLPDHTIARLLGHTQTSITSRYIHMEKSVIEASNLVAQETIKLMRLRVF
jgi:integrase